MVLATHAHRAEEEAKGRVAARQVAEGTKLLRMDPEGVIESFSDYNALVRELAERRNIPLLDLRNAVPPESRYFGDHTHFSAEGSVLAAKATAELLQKIDLSAQRAPR